MLKRKKFFIYALALSLILWQGVSVTRVKAAETVLDTNIYQTADVRLQDDFYTAINKDWLKNTQIKDGRVMASAFNDVGDVTNEQLKSLVKEVAASKNNYAEDSDERNIAVLYENYLNKEQRNKQGIEPIKGLIKKINDINSLDDLNDLHKEQIGNTLIQFSCSVDAKDATRYALYIRPTVLLVRDSDECTNPTEETKNRVKLQKEYYLKMFMLTGYSESEAQQKVDNAYKLMDMVAPHIIGQKEASTDDNIREKCYNVVTINKHEDMAPNLKIKDYLKNIKADTADKIIL